MKELLFSIFIYWCYIFASDAQQTDATKGIKAIVEQKCIKCHFDGGAAPFAFNSFEDLIQRKGTVKYVVENRLMPIWKPDPKFSHFADENYLSDEEIKMIKDWLDNDSKNQNSKIKFSKEVIEKTILKSKPDYVVTTKSELKLQPIGEDLFGIVKIPFEFNEAFDVGAIVFENDQKKLLHHVSIFILEDDFIANRNENSTPSYFFQPPIKYLDSLPKDFNVYRYLNIVPEGKYEYWDRMIYKTHSQPGKTPSAFPVGCGFRMPKKGVILLDMIHYLQTPKVEFDNIRIKFYKQQKAKRAAISASIGIGNPNSTGSHITLLPNQQKWLESSTVLPADMSLFEITPHMHQVGRKYIAVAITPQNDTIPLIKIDNWDMGWQETYRFEKLLKLPKGTQIVISGYYDNSAANPYNPNKPPNIVRQSMNKQDEMLLLMLTFFEYKEGDEKQKIQYSLKF